MWWEILHFDNSVMWSESINQHMAQQFQPRQDRKKIVSSSTTPKAIFTCFSSPSLPFSFFVLSCRGFSVSCFALLGKLLVCLSRKGFFLDCWCGKHWRKILLISSCRSPFEAKKFFAFNLLNCLFGLGLSQSDPFAWEITQKITP